MTIAPTRGRYAPSPTGDIHLGNARTALVAWLAARSKGGEFVWRVEDLDGPRVVAGSEVQQIEDLLWLGLDWDVGPGHLQDQAKETLRIALAPDHQSDRSELYSQALQHLESTGRLFPCPLTRKDLRSLASAPHHAESSPYPKEARPKERPSGWLEVLLESKEPVASVRFTVEPDDDPVEFEDLLSGRIVERVSETTGDFVLRRRDGLWAYQLAVVVDDAQQGITEVVRGQDLLSSTARQVLLQRALGVPTPRYTHVPLLIDEHGDKLSKRHPALTLRTLRQSGWRSTEIVGYLAWTLGQRRTREPIEAAALIDWFDLSAIPLDPVVVPDNFIQQRQAPPVLP